MTQAKGALAQLIGGIKEDSYGVTPGSPSGVLLPIISSGIKATQPLNESAVLRGRRDAAKPDAGNITVAGPVVVPVDQLGLGYWLQKLFGDPTTSGTGPYSHVYKVGNTIDSWVIEHGYTDISQFQLFNGGKVNSMAFSFDAGANAELTATVQVEGQKETWSASSVDAAASELALSRFSIGDLALTEGGASIANVTKIDFTIGNNIDGNQFVIGGGGVRGNLPEGKCAVGGNITAFFEDRSLLDKATNGTESKIVATLSSGSYSLAFEFNELRYHRDSPGIPGPQGLLITLPFTAYYDDDGGDSIATVTLTNSQASY